MCFAKWHAKQLVFETLTLNLNWHLSRIDMNAKHMLSDTLFDVLTLALSEKS